jgi:hypothetical protein
MLRWRRFSSPCILGFLPVDVEALVLCYPRTLAIGYVLYVNISSLYEVLCYLSEIAPCVFVVNA